MSLLPRTQGIAPIRTPGPEFLKRFRERVEAGLLLGRPHPRSNYVATGDGPTELHVRAADWWTAINVGLNELDLDLSSAGVAQYRVRYWRWALFVIGLATVLGLIGLLLLLTLDVRTYVVQHPAQVFRRLSPDQNVLVAWAMVLFWGFLWPWLLILLHKGPLRRLVERLIKEVDTGAAPGTVR